MTHDYWNAILYPYIMTLHSIVLSIFQSIFPGCHLIPFGSTLSGLGRADSDMDIVMRLAADNVDNVSGVLVVVV